MNESQLPLVLTVLAGLLLLWRVTVRTGFLPLSTTLRLYRESFGVLRQHGWILLVFLTGAAASLLVTETKSVLVMRAHPQKIVAQFQVRHNLEIPWKTVLQKAGWRGLSATSSSAWAAPCRGVGLWLAGVALVAYRRRIFPQILPADCGSSTTTRWLRRAIWVGASAWFVWIAIQFVTAVGPDVVPNHRGFQVAWSIFLQALSLFCAAFWVVAGAYLAGGLLHSARQANATGNARPALLLEVNAVVFRQLLKFFVFVTAMTGVLPQLLVVTVSRFRWFQPFFKALTDLEHVFALLVFPVMFRIVLEHAEWRPALRQVVDMWRRHAGEWLALLLPVFALAFAGHVLRQRMLFSIPPTACAWLITNVITEAIGAMVSAWWLVTVVRWWDVTKTRAGQ